jgi:diguanylate cyclase (GGDEF)-like protein
VSASSDHKSRSGRAELKRPKNHTGSSRSIIRPTEAWIIGTALIAAMVFFHFFDGFEHLIAFLQPYEGWELDEVLFVILLSGGATLFIAVRRTLDLRGEIAVRMEVELRALELAHDPLCGLPNRQLLAEELSTAISAGSPFAILLIDLDRFKPINDLHGHEVGDRLLVAVAERLRLVDRDLFVSRLGGDEFVCLMREELSQERLGQLAGSIVGSLCQPFLIAGRTLNIGATIGVASFPNDLDDANGLLRAADLAMYCAKRSGRGTYAFYDTGLEQEARERAELEVQVREALRQGEIGPYFQPILDLRTGAVSGFEALARWEHPARGLMEPSAFLPIIEDVGLHDELLEAILTGAVSAARAWPDDMSLALNVSSSQLKDPLFASRFILLLRQVNFPPERLIIEVTEDSIGGNMAQTAATFAALRGEGVRMALDDFGKSYANLSWLRELRFDHLKIHGSFLQTASDPDRNVLHALVALAKELGMPARAQGVETSELEALLRELGCAHAQGFHFGRAMSPNALKKMKSDGTCRTSSRAA